MDAKNIEYGTFSNGVEYIAVGSGVKSILMCMGGPGNDLPKGFMLKNLYLTHFKPIYSHYKLFLVSRKSNLPKGYTTEMMAQDYVEIIQKDLEGKIHAIIGFSFGGMILQHLVALNPEVAEKFIILSSAHKVSEKGLEIDISYAKLRSQGKTGAAFAKIVEAIYPKGIKRFFFKLLLKIMGPFMGKPTSPTFRYDILIEAEAEKNHDAIEHLKSLQKPVIIVSGDKDIYFPQNYYEEMYEMIPEAILMTFHDLGHDVFEDPKAIQYILDKLNAPDIRGIEVK